MQGVLEGLSTRLVTRSLLPGASPLALIKRVHTPLLPSTAFMPSRRSSKPKPNFTQRKNLFLQELGHIALAMHPCKRCLFSRVPCQIGENSDKCVGCVSSGQHCSLAISLATIKRIHNERKRIRDEVRKTRATLNRLERQLEVLEDQEEEMVSAEWQNIHDLEAEEKSSEAAPSSSGFLFDVSSELFQLAPGLNWPSLPLPDFGETAAGGSGSSQGSR